MDILSMVHACPSGIPQGRQEAIGCNYATIPNQILEIQTMHRSRIFIWCILDQDPLRTETFYSSHRNGCYSVRAFGSMSPSILRQLSEEGSDCIALDTSPRTESVTITERNRGT
eukprot:jgi/Psemu1/303725/fgenesh1_kg.120_\